MCHNTRIFFHEFANRLIHQLHNLELTCPLVTLLELNLRYFCTLHIFSGLFFSEWDILRLVFLEKELAQTFSL